MRAASGCSARGSVERERDDWDERERMVGTPTTPMPLTPVAPLPTGDAEAQIGLAKVAEPDMDAFRARMLLVDVSEPPPLPPMQSWCLLPLIPSCANQCSDATDSSSPHATVPHAQPPQHTSRAATVHA
ncbi:hypothetical protein GGX14DRAFT_668040 [Mycena pura]|uniref:Uncharacterized protein n=1 Tax=Mycena pura TaxID=153505 RepID=A0AAD6Y9A8_9AGAR|nr:hypothetical protein GGX14DRAFT_668040 [Mycena pura]